MAKINPWILVFGALAIGGFVWALDERDKRKKSEELLERKNEDYLMLLHEYLNKIQSMPDEIKNQLIHLRNSYAGIQDDIAIELKTIVELLEANQEEIAIEKLTKVIENLLKEKYVAEGKAKSKKNCPKLFKMLDEALEFKWISKKEYHISYMLKEKRNENAHELAIKYPNNWKVIAFLGGIELIYNLKGIKY